MSGTGKSSVVARLAELGFHAVDTDFGYASPGPDGDWIWHDERIEELLGGYSGAPLFVSGCVSNQGRFYERFDAVILLTAPTETILERIRKRSGNDFGKAPEERTRILEDLDLYEPALRRTADRVIDTRQPLDAVVNEILQIATEGQTRR